MTRFDKVLTAMREAQRFLDRCEELMERHATDDQFLKSFQAGLGSKETGAVKRASMDLSRALTEVRR